MAVTLHDPRTRRIPGGSDASKDGDRLSNLPEPVIHYIFSFLETIDVIRASAVARKWSSTAEHCGYRLHKLLKGICNTKALKLSVGSVEFLRARAKPVCFSTPFYNLKSLKLAMCTGGFQMQSVINLLNCSPNLEALTICYDDGADDDDWNIPDEAFMCLRYHLKMVELLNFLGTENEIELVRFLLKNGHMLQELTIKWVKDCWEDSAQIWSFLDCLQMLL